MSTKLKSVNSSAAALATGAASTTVCNVHTLPLAVIETNFATSAKGDKPKVILSLAVPQQGVGSISVFAPSYMSYDEQFAFLEKYFEHGDTIDGAQNQDAIYFKQYEVGGPNFEIISVEGAKKKMQVTGLNSSIMTFGTANAQQSRQQIQDATNITRGNVGKVIVANEGRLSSFLGAVANAFK